MVFKWYMALLQTRPVLTRSLTTGVLMATGDVLAQALERYGEQPEGKAPKAFDVLRTGRMLTFGTLWVGPALHVWYSFLTRIVPGSSAGQVVLKMCIDQAVFAPLAAGSFFIGLGALEGRSAADIESKVRTGFVPTLIANYKVWPAVQLINFKLVPTALQPLFVNCVALGWNTYLSLMNSRASAHLD